jgi:hypothetical protein
MNYGKGSGDEAGLGKTWPISSHHHVWILDQLCISSEGEAFDKGIEIQYHRAPLSIE